MNIRIFQKLHNDRGVALLIVLLVTTLLIALIFEFAYATRVSMRSAVNFRDSQRAYFLARSGINYAAKSLKDRDLRKYFPPQGEWMSVPIVREGDVELRIRWENEEGKISIQGTVTGDTDALLSTLVTDINFDQEILKRMSTSKYNFQLLSELHGFMKDEEYDKISPFLTVYVPQGQKININFAPEDVLSSVLRTKQCTTNGLEIITSKRKTQPYTASDLGTDPCFTDVNNIYKIISYVRVNDFTKQIEAIVDISKSPPQNILYWRSL